MPGKLFVIEGLDGSGKGTQTKLLFDSLSALNYRVRRVSFPNYASPSSALIKMYLSGELGADPNALNAYAISSFYAADRFVSYMQDWKGFYQSGGIIIADRYTTSNAIYQCIKLSESEWDTYLDWLFDYEYRLLGIPEPDKVIYLRVAPEVSQRLMSVRYAGDENKKDIHEADVHFQQKAHYAASYCAEHLSWSVVECTSNGDMRSIDDIQSEIQNIVTSSLQ